MPRVGAPVALSGRYASQGRQMAAGLTAWGRATGATLQLEDDRSEPSKSVEIFASLVDSDCDLVLGPYGSDSVRKVAASLPAMIVWNHGAAADDVQQLKNVVALPSPSSRYLVALAGAVAQLRPGGTLAVVLAAGRFAQYAWEGLEHAARTLELNISNPYGFDNFALSPPEGPGRGVDDVDAVLTIGPVEKEIALFRELVKRRSSLIIGGVSPGLINFAALLGTDPEGFLAPVQWHASVGREPRLGPSSSEIVRHVNAIGLPPLDYVGAQAYAAALIASHCHQLDALDPLDAARSLRTSTFFGDYELDAKTGVQIGHRLQVIRWHSGGQELLSDGGA